MMTGSMMLKSHRRKSEMEFENYDELFPALEAVLFAAGYPLSYDRLAEITGRSGDEIKEALVALSAKYASEEYGIQVVLFDESCQMCTKEGHEELIRRALGIKQGGRLSTSSLETLAIVAYRQPVTRSQIERIRGVDSSYAVSSLVMKNLIEEKGRLDMPGRPVLYGTTVDFLRCFGLSSLDELPDASSFLGEFDKKEQQEGEFTEQEATDQELPDRAEADAEADRSVEG